jgi:hypothetical protein
MQHRRNRGSRVRRFGTLLRSVMFACLLALVNLGEMKLNYSLPETADFSETNLTHAVASSLNIYAGVALGEHGSQIDIRCQHCSHSLFIEFVAISHNPSEGVASRSSQEHMFQGTMLAAFLSLALVVALASAQVVDPSQIRRRVTCTNSYSCPPYSYRTPGRDCYDTINDCTCESGYKKDENYCVKACDYQCPQYSYRTPGRDCYDTINDCTCESGYKKDGNYCVKERTCDYKCPQYSYRTPGRSCYDGFGDCTCEAGYKKEGNYCVKERTCDYKCPQYSYRTPGRSCYDGFGDCTCEYGYMKSGNYCVKK